MQFEIGETYHIDYGLTAKLATFLGKEEDKNVFFDVDGKFSFTDSFIAKGKIKFTKMEVD